MSGEPIDALLVFSDIHSGCQMALVPPDGSPLDNGGRYMPSLFQQKLWGWWHEFTTQWVPHVMGDRRWVVVNNGDTLDGRHHNNTTTWTTNLSDMVRNAYELLAPAIEAWGVPYYHIRGTEAHGGQAGEDEERLAGKLGAVPNGIGQHARYELLKWLGDEFSLVHILHHIGTTSSTAYESTAVLKELVDMYTEGAQWRERPPDVVVRSHRHRPIKVELPTINERAFAIVTPGWQGKTPLVHRIAGARVKQPVFGGVAIILSDEGEHYSRQYVRRLERPAAE